MVMSWLQGAKPSDFSLLAVFFGLAPRALSMLVTFDIKLYALYFRIRHSAVD
jgi:hypothetical protein